MSVRRENFGTRHLSFIQQLEAAKASVANIDPWENQLRRVRGDVGSGGEERISTEGVFDALDLPAFQRTAEAGKRVKSLMHALGWVPVRARHVTGRGPGGKGARLRQDGVTVYRVPIPERPQSLKMGHKRELVPLPR
jgi:hypothetical protein